MIIQNWTLSNAKTLFQNSLSDTQNIGPCKSKDDEETIIPERYDWREQFPDCVQPVANQGNCSSSYITASLGVAQDRICQSSKKQVKLSAQEIVNCDKSNYQCDGGYVTRVFNWGKRKGFIPEQCYPYEGKVGECEDDHLESNECRVNNQLYRVIDYCLATDELGIKKEILKNGPVAAQMVVYTDFLTYKEGAYHRTEDSFKFNGQHVVKIVGWERQGENGENWIVENSWGADWGEDGYFKHLISDKSTGLDFYGIGVAVYPYTLAEYYAAQEQMQNQQTGEQPAEEDVVDLDQAIADEAPVE